MYTKKIVHIYLFVVGNILLNFSINVPVSSNAQSRTELLFQTGLNALDERSYDLAITRFTTLIKSNPDVPSLYINRGIAKYHSKKYTAAIKDYNNALQIIKTDDRGRFKSTVITESLYSLIYLNRGAAYYELVNMSLAKIDFTFVIDLDRLNKDRSDLKTLELISQVSSAYTNRGDVNRSINQLNEATSDYLKAIERNPNNIQAYLNRATVRYELSLYKEALDDIQEAINKLSSLSDTSSQLAEAYNKQGAIYYAMGYLADSLDSYNESIKFSQSCAECYYNRGISFRKNNNIELATIDFTKAAELYRKQGKTKQYSIVINAMKNLR